MADPALTTDDPPAAAPPHDGLCDEQGPIPTFPPRQLDERGRLIPLSQEARAARSAAILRALKAVAKLPDDPGDGRRWRDAMHDLDAHRPHRPLFEGSY
jgi:hypothetical protein